jgi:hypothetical protein
MVLGKPEPLKSQSIDELSLFQCLFQGFFYRLSF